MTATDVSLFTVFGHPISHSLSPWIHQAFARQFGIVLEYTTTDASPEAFDQSVLAFFAQHGRGANVTLPHKRRAFELASQRSAQAQRVGTANVLTPLPEGGLAAHNTDGAGFIRDLTERHGADLRGQTVLLLGAGGAARGVAWNLVDAGIDSMTIVNRSPAAADQLMDDIGLPGRVHSRYWEDLGRIGSFDLIVHATSAGVLGQAMDLPFSLTTGRSMAYDLSYGAAAAGFLAWARAAGCSHAWGGLGMLIETAADAFELWHGLRPDTDLVYAELIQRYS
ncbi:shikimate dehydrogenase [Frateuria aurantia]